jgi:hypothetical protein
MGGAAWAATHARMSTSSTSTSGGALTASTAASVGNGALLPTTGPHLAGMVLTGPGAGMLFISLRAGPG